MPSTIAFNYQTTPAVDADIARTLVTDPDYRLAGVKLKRARPCGWPARSAGGVLEGWGGATVRYGKRVWPLPLRGDGG